MRICDKSYFVNPYTAQAHQTWTRIRVFAARTIHRREHHTLEWRMSMTVPPIRKAGTPISVIATEAVLAAALIFAGGLFAGCGNNVNASSAGPRPAMKVAVECSDPLPAQRYITLFGLYYGYFHRGPRTSRRSIYIIAASCEQSASKD